MKRIHKIWFNRIKKGWLVTLAMMLIIQGFALAKFNPGLEPLVRKKGPKPNIVFLLDNSGAMGRLYDQYGLLTKYGIPDFWKAYYESLKIDRRLMIGTLGQWLGTDQIRTYGTGQAILERFIRKYGGRTKYGLWHFNYSNPHEMAAAHWYHNNRNNPTHSNFPNAVTEHTKLQLSYAAYNEAMRKSDKLSDFSYGGKWEFGKPSLQNIGYDGIRYPIQELIAPDENLEQALNGERVLDAIYNAWEVMAWNVDKSVAMPMHTYANTIYDITKVLRGYGIPKAMDLVDLSFTTNKGSHKGTGDDSINQGGSAFQLWGKPTWSYYKNPQKYRCEQSHIIVLSQFEIHLRDGVYGVLPEDTLLSTGNCYSCYGNPYNVVGKNFKDFLVKDALNHNISGGYDIVSRSQDLELLGNQIKAMDLRLFPGRAGTVGERPSLDAAGKPWFNAAEKPSKISVHAVKIGAFPDPDTNKYVKDHQRVKIRKLVEITGGVYTEAKSPSQLDAAISNMLKEFVQRTYKPQLTILNPNVGNNTLVYQLFYDPWEWTGELVASRFDEKTGEFNDVWTTQDTLEPRKFGLTGLNDSVNSIRIANANINGKGLQNETYTELEKWHGGFVNGQDRNPLAQPVNYFYGRYEDKITTRSTPLGSTINSQAALMTPDNLYNNTSKLEAKWSKILNNNLVDRAFVNGGASYVVVGSSDGLLNFITIESFMTPNDSRVGKRDIAIMPHYFFKHKSRDGVDNGRAINGMESISRSLVAGMHEHRIDGSVAIFDGLINRNGEIKPLTVGMATYGAGGNGYLGFKFNHVDNPSISMKTSKGIVPTFEMEPDSLEATTLGYTYSGIDFFNVRKDNASAPEIIAVIGNGYGKPGSSLWFIDAVTGDKKTEIVLNKNGGGAGTPMLVIEKDHETGFHKPTKAYVGDFSGNLYKVTFGDYYLDAPMVKLIFSDPWSRTISGQPRVLYNNSDEWVYFGTGLLAEESARLDSNSQDHFYAIQVNDEQVEFSDLIKQEILFTEEVTRANDDPRKLKDANLTEYRISTSANVDRKIPKDKKGWYLKLNLRDHVVESPFFYENRYVGVRTSSILMGTPEGNDPCYQDSVLSKVIFLDSFTGNQNKDLWGGYSGFAVEGDEISTPAGLGVVNGNAYGGIGVNSRPDDDTIKKLGAGSQWSETNNPKDKESGCLVTSIGGQIMCLDMGSIKNELRGRLYFHRRM